MWPVAIVMPRTITAASTKFGQWCMIAFVAATKSDLRARIRAARSAAPDPDARDREREGLLAAARTAGLLDPDRTTGAHGALAIAAYIASPGEPDVAGIRSAIRDAGGTVLLPIPRPDRTLDWAHDDGRYRPEGRYPIEVPAGAVIGSGVGALLAHGVRTILVPALAVDRSGTRLGQGGGYYDRLLAELATWVAPYDGSRTAAAGGTADELRPVAVVRDEELLPAGTLPRELHDKPMAAVLTPTRYEVLGR
jgi:5-formyltetrahydrofolate cyclo-ligase